MEKLKLNQVFSDSSDQVSPSVVDQMVDEEYQTLNRNHDAPRTPNPATGTTRFHPNQNSSVHVGMTDSPRDVARSQFAVSPILTNVTNQPHTGTTVFGNLAHSVSAGTAETPIYAQPATQTFETFEEPHLPMSVDLDEVDNNNTTTLNKKRPNKVSSSKTNLGWSKYNKQSSDHLDYLKMELDDQLDSQSYYNSPNGSPRSLKDDKAWIK